MAQLITVSVCSSTANVYLVWALLFALLVVPVIACLVFPVSICLELAPCCCYAQVKNVLFCNVFYQVLLSLYFHLQQCPYILS